jgi:hypothetical protein
MKQNIHVDTKKDGDCGNNGQDSLKPVSPPVPRQSKPLKRRPQAAREL